MKWIAMKSGTSTLATYKNTQEIKVFTI